MSFAELPCRHRGLEVTSGVSVCSSPKILGQKIVTLAICSDCILRDHPPTPSLRTLPRLQDCLRLERRTDPATVRCLDPAHQITQERDCWTCGDYLFPMFTLETPPEQIGRIFDWPTRSQPNNWWTWPNVREGFRLAIQQRLQELQLRPVTWPGMGRGIVIVGGGKYTACAYVTIRVIRHTGCTLPIELWHFDGEVSPAIAAELQRFGVKCRNGDQHPEAGRYRFQTGYWKGWQLKPFAIAQSSFEEVIYLDADCYPTKDPEYLLDWSVYRERGAIFWRDLPVSDWSLTRDIWAIFGIDSDELPIESGQLVINKKRCAEAMALTWWLNQRADFVYRILYGDKDTFTVAWKFMGLPYGLTVDRPEWDQHCFLHRDHAGDVIFQHRCRDKFRINNEAYPNTPQNLPANMFNPRLMWETECFEFLEEFRSRFNQQSEMTDRSS